MIDRAVIELRDSLDLAVDILILAIKKEWEGQGKVASKKAINSIERAIRVRFTSVEIDVLVEDYMEYQDRGVDASNVAFTPGPGGSGGKSQLIEALIEWSKYIKPSLSDRERKGFAFAVATIMSREGMPTRNSINFSPNGRNLHWSDYALESVEEEIFQLLEASNFPDELVNGIVFEVQEYINSTN